MVEIVIDTSALLAAILAEPERAALIEATRGATLSVPPSVPWEIGNALSALVRRHRLSSSEAAKAAAAFERIPVRHVQIELQSALELATDLGLYAYDAYILEAARMRRCSVLTLDRSMMRAANSAGIPFIEVL